MRGWLEPVGDAPANTYWLRRGLILLIVIGLLAALVWGIGRLTGGPGPTTATPQTTASAEGAAPTTQASTEPAPEPTPAEPAPEPTPAEPAPEPTPAEPAPEPTPTAPPACRIGALAASIEGTNPLPAGQATVFRVSITTTQASCLLDLAVEPAQLTITSGSDQIWTTASCPDWHPAGQFTLTPETPAVVEIGWPTLRGDGCGLVETQLGAGTYVASFAIGALSSRYVFQIS